MNHSERHELDELRRQLFRTARNEGPSREAHERARRSLGLTGAALTTFAASEAAAAGASKGVELGGCSAAAKLSTAAGVSSSLGTIVKIFALGALGAAVWVAVPELRHEGDPIQLKAEQPKSEAPAPRATPPNPTPTIPLEQQTRGPIDETPAPERIVKRAAPAPRRPRASAQPSRNESANARPIHSLSAEIATLDQARRELLDGNVFDALVLLDHYTSEFGDGNLKLEASVLRIEALETDAQHEAAAALGRKFIEDHPNDPLVDRVHAILEGRDRQAATVARAVRAVHPSR